MADPIKFYAQISKVQTLADGGLRFTFDVPESAIMAAAELMTFKQHGIVVDAVLTERPKKQVDSGGQTGNVEAGTKRKSKWTTAEKPGVDGNLEKRGEQDAA